MHRPWGRLAGATDELDDTPEVKKLKDKIQRLKEELKDERIESSRLKINQSARRHEEDELRNCLNRVGVKFDPTQTPGDQIVRCCNQLMTERNSILASLSDLEGAIGPEGAMAGQHQRYQSELAQKARELEEKTESLERMSALHHEDTVKMARLNQEWETHYETLIRETGEKVDKERSKHADEMGDLAMRGESEREKLLSKLDSLDRKANDTRQRYEVLLADQQTSYESKLAHTLSNYEVKRDAELSELLEIQDRETMTLKERIRDLEGDLLSQADDFRPPTDSALLIKFTELHQLLRSVTFPHNLSLPANIALPPNLDSSGFLDRCGAGKLGMFLLSLFWGVVVERFFSADFGFGALGPGPGRTLLMEIEASWERLSQGAGGRATTDNPTGAARHLDVMYHDYQANRWRAALFQSLGAIMRREPGAEAETVPEAAKYFEENVRDARKRLLEIIETITRKRAEGAIRQKISQLTRLAGELALEFGAQRADLRLILASPGGTVRMGPDFVDSLDGPRHHGREFVVDLLVSPGLSKLGDGRGDMTTRRVLKPAEVFPVPRHD